LAAVGNSMDALRYVDEQYVDADILKAWLCNPNATRSRVAYFPMERKISHAVIVERKYAPWDLIDGALTEWIEALYRALQGVEPFLWQTLCADELVNPILDYYGDLRQDIKSLAVLKEWAPVMDLYRTLPL